MIFQTDCHTHMHGPSRNAGHQGDDACSKLQRCTHHTMWHIKSFRNCSVPFGAPYGDFGIYNTEYRTVMNLTSRRYYFELTTSPNVVWADLDQFDLEPGAPVLALDPDSLDLSGNVSGNFAQTDAPF